MKLTKWMAIAIAIVCAVATNAATVTFSGTNGAAWSVDANWSDGAVPSGDDTAVITNGAVVNFDYGSGWPSANTAAVHVDGTVSAANPVRSWTTAWSFGPTSTLDGATWLTLQGNGSAFIFDSGATLTNITGSLELNSNSDVTLGFNLDAAGFQKLTASTLQINGYVGQTILVDMASYTGPTQNISLIEFTHIGGSPTVTDALFQTLNLVVTNNSGYPASLIWDEEEDAIVLDMGVIDYDVVWDDGGADNNWTTAANWDNDTGTAGGDVVHIGSGYSVNWNFGGGWHTPGNPSAVYLEGTLTSTDALRSYGTVWNIGETAELDLGTSALVLWGGGSEFIFDAGATMTNMSGSIQFANNADVALGFNLDADGFQTLKAGGWLVDGFAGQTIRVDMADYTGPIKNITLVDFASAGGMTSSTFTNFNLVVANNNGGYPANLVWDEASASIKLDMGAMDYDVIWDDGGSDNNWLTAENWDNDSGTGNGDVVYIGSGYSVNWNFGGGWHSPGNPDAVYLDGTLTSVDALRSYGTAWTIGSTAELDLGLSWLVLWGGGSEFIFDAGATMTNMSGNIQFANNADVTLGFNLDAGGFPTLKAGGWVIDGFAAQTILVDMAEFSSAPQNITLVDFSNGGTLTDAEFQNFNLIVTNDSGYGATLVWDDAADAIVLDMGAIDYDVVWDDGGTDSDWATADNWNPNAVPGGSDTVLIGSGAVVTNAQTVFGGLNISSGASVTFASQFLAEGNQIISDGQLNFPGGTARLNGATLTLGSSGSLSSSMGWLDLLNGTINFEDGASFGNANMGFEHKGNNTIGFKLSETGFTTIQAGALHAGNGATWSDATYNIDISEYNHANGLSIVLADYSSVFSGPFNPTINIIAGDSGLNAVLTLDELQGQLILAIDPPGNDAPVATDLTVSVPTVDPVAFTLVATDIEGSNLTYTVESQPAHGTLSGAAPNLTYTPTNSTFIFDTFTFTASDGDLVSNTGTVTMARIPYTDNELWDTYHDAILNDPLNVEWSTNWVDNGISIWQIRYELGDWVGTQTNATPKIAAFYAYPVGGTNLPGLVQIHGGGQRGMWEMAKLWAEQGYAAISINWGALPLLDGQPNTDWDGLASGFTREGVTDAIFHNWCDPKVYSDGVTLYDVPHPMNSSWIHNAYAGRRALTFLTSQSIVDADKLGVVGWSMGGNTTSKVATDPRLTAVGPGVGGTGFLYEDWWGLPGSGRSTNGVVAYDLHIRTVDSQSYWPDITAPTLYLEAANDFNAPFDLVIKALSLQPTNVPQRLAVSPHFNHRNWPDAEVSRILWMKTHLTESFDFPETSPAELDLSNPDGVPRFRVWPDTSTTNPIVSVDIYYGIERDSRLRFWRDTIAVETNGYWEAECPIYDLDEMMAAMAIVKYDAGFETPLYSGQSSTFSVASDVHLVYPPELANNGVKEVAEKTRLIDDFALGYKDWWYVNLGNVNQQLWTRKLGDPSWRGPAGGQLAFDVTTTASGNTLGLHLDTEQWNTTAATTYKAKIALPVSGVNSLSLPVSAFTNGNGVALTTWDNVKQLALMPANALDGLSPEWSGDAPAYSNLRWESGEWIFVNGVGSDYLEEYDLPLNDGAVLDDADGDGLLTWEEEFAGTNPTNSASALRVAGTVTPVANGQEVQWSAVAGKSYSVWFKTNLADTVWSEAGTGIPGVESLCTHTVVTDSATGFVRVEVE